MYALGIDYGTLSGRAVLLNLETGEEVAEAVYEYPHGVMDERFLDGTSLPQDYALQDPNDYLEVLKNTVTQVIKKSGIDSAEIIGVGLDFTACTILPVYADGTPLCFCERFKNNPHAYVKLWKHHAAQSYADKINELAAGCEWIKRYGGKVSSEWMLPKIMQIAVEAKEVCDSAERFMEAGDWIVMQLTGQETHNVSMAGFKALWNSNSGYPNGEFLSKLCIGLDKIISTKVSNKISQMHTLAGKITENAAALTGLKAGTAVSVCNIDAHAALPAVGITRAGKMLMIMGTSTCHIFMSEKEKMVKGICGVVDGGIIEGLYAYEAGQACVGDHFDWFISNMVPKEYFDEAESLGIGIHELLCRKVESKKVGETGLLALDWWNGNRSTLVDAELTGMILGMNLRTKPEDIYLALIEATAYGTRMIAEAFYNEGIEIEELYASGGIAEKNGMMMQIYADVLDREIKISDSAQASARGSAMSSAVAAGYFKDMHECAEKLSRIKEESYKPIAENVQAYNEIYAEYKRLYEYFGYENDVMKRLKRIKER